jgi:hypothetical protein
MLTSSFQRLEKDSWPPWNGTWEISHRLLNSGTQPCVIQLQHLAGLPATLPPAQDVKQTEYSISRPQPLVGELSFGIESPPYISAKSKFMASENISVPFCSNVS